MHRLKLVRVPAGFDAAEVGGFCQRQGCKVNDEFAAVLNQAVRKS